MFYKQTNKLIVKFYLFIIIAILTSADVFAVEIEMSKDAPITIDVLANKIQKNNKIIMIKDVQSPAILNNIAVGSVEIVGKGVVVNQDGNDQGLIYNSKGNKKELFGGAIKVEITFNILSLDINTSTPLISYATDNQSNEFVIYNDEDGKLKLCIGGKKVALNILSSEIYNGKEHIFALNWDNANGKVKINLDGHLKKQVFVAKDYIIGKNGTLIFGQKQNKNGEKFDAKQTFSGKYNDISIWINNKKKAHWTMGAIKNRIIKDELGNFDLIATEKLSHFNGVSIYNKRNIRTVGQEIKFTPNNELGKLQKGESKNITLRYFVSDGNVVSSSFVIVKINGKGVAANSNNIKILEETMELTNILIDTTIINDEQNAWQNGNEQERISKENLTDSDDEIVKFDNELSVEQELIISTHLDNSNILKNEINNEDDDIVNQLIENF